MIRHLPNFLTLCNLVCGAVAILFLLEGNTMPTAWLVWVCCVFDFLDGFAARSLKVSSPIGKELDSLADVISFGLLPAFYMYTLIGQHTTNAWLPFAGLSIAAFSALRLAIFNVDETQSDTFKGLNTPANTLFITSLGLLPAVITKYIFIDWILVGIAIGFSLLLVSNLRFFAFKFKSAGWKGNELRYTFIGLSIVYLVAFGTSGIPLIILSYIAISAIVALLGKKV